MLSRTLNRFRRDLGKPDLPLMVGQMGQFTRWHYGQNRVNEAQEIVCKTTPSCRFVSSTGLPSRGDRLHFSTNGSRELGIRYAKNLLDIVTSSKPALSRQSVAKSEPPVVLRKNKEPQRSTSPADRAKQSTLPSTQSTTVGTIGGQDAYLHSCGRIKHGRTRQANVW